MWRSGPAITITATNVKQQMTTSVGLAKAVRIMHNPGNSGILYVGDSTLDSGASPKEGVLGWIDNPDASAPGDVFLQFDEHDAPNGLLTDHLYVAGTQNDVVLWSYLEQ